MPDREKVMTWLEICGKNNDCSGCCPYSENGFGEYGQCRESLMADAYTLLKEQEAKPPAIMQDIEGIWLTCSMCGHKLHPILAMKMDTYLPKFCSKCGQAVKWE